MPMVFPIFCSTKSSSSTFYDTFFFFVVCINNIVWYMESRCYTICAASVFNIGYRKNIFPLALVNESGSYSHMFIHFPFHFTGIPCCHIGNDFYALSHSLCSYHRRSSFFPISVHCRCRRSSSLCYYHRHRCSSWFFHCYHRSTYLLLLNFLLRLSSMFKPILPSPFHSCVCFLASDECFQQNTLYCVTFSRVFHLCRAYERWSL